jgi:hypothetical protein
LLFDFISPAISAEIFSMASPTSESVSPSKNEELLPPVTFVSNYNVPYDP